MTDGEQPDLDEIEEHFVALLDGRITRDAVDRWAGRWLADDSLSWDELNWWALGLLHGIDLRHGPGGAYLHDDSQVQDWLAEFRSRRTR
ncbi:MULTISPECIES: hypothetical protein [Amycolatopsis]|uniref:Uncharacterized protein n=1 Tax=Amycolatopsis dendrobii TaxID=2760662 RepID=A0A7W3VSZ3_9PSEU|nr:MULTISPECIES: hypothetical protein [Amycolatopsis]MBB1152646.1 hypothetical protein [Amycolatopsis dendrobii]UKD52173.1 hypothetical protein L3Q65_30175 [Amycolatopsis sp. FU40]